METGKIHKSILSLAGPAFLSQASFTITGIIDLMMVGTISPEAIAAVGLGGTLFWNLMVLFGGPGISIVFLCGQAFGSRDLELFSRRAFAGIYICIILGIGFSIFPSGLAGFFYRLLGAEPSVIAEGVRYFRFRLIGFPIHLAAVALEGAIKATGNTKTPMALKVIGHICNIFGNYVLIFGKIGFPALGTAGAGIASLISDIVTLAGFSLFFYLTFLKKEIPIKLIPGRAAAFLVLKEGFKVSVQGFASSFSILIYTSFIARLGALSLAANQIAVSIISMSFLPAHGLGQAGEILISQAVGRGQPEEAKKTGFRVMGYCTFLMLLFGLVIGILPEKIGALYTKESSVVFLLIPMLRISALFQLFDAIQIVLSAALRAAGETTYLLLATLAGSWLLFIPLVWIIINTLGGGITAAWSGRYVLMFFLTLLFILRYLRLDWRAIKPKK